MADHTLELDLHTARRAFIEVDELQHKAALDLLDGLELGAEAEGLVRSSINRAFEAVDASSSMSSEALAVQIEALSARYSN